MNELQRLKRARKLRLQEIQSQIEEENCHYNAFRDIGRHGRGRLDVVESCIGDNSLNYARFAGPQWMWLDDAGTWLPFDQVERERIENAFQLNKKTIPFLDGLHFLHTIDLKNMVKVDMRTGYSRKVKRVPEYGLESQQRTRRRYENLEEDLDVLLDMNSDNYTGDLTCLPASSRKSSRGVVPSGHRDPCNFTLLGNQFDIPLRSGMQFWSRHGELMKRGRLQNSRIKRKPDQQKVRTRAQKPSVPDTKAKNGSTSDKIDYDYVPLQNWLKKFKLFDECFNKLKKEKVTLKELKQLSEDQMRSIGLPLGSCKRLMAALRRHPETLTLPNEFLCPITTDVMKDPVVASDGFTYERMAIIKWLEEHDRSPLTNEALCNKELTPNRQLKKLIEDYSNGTVHLHSSNEP